MAIYTAGEMAILPAVADSTCMAQYNSFVVKIWSDDNGGLHGHIVHVATQEKRHFLNLDRMIEFILEHLGPAEVFQDNAVPEEKASSSSLGEDDSNSEE
ncbi:MAG: hypothetical protein ACE5I2_07995 [Anaerolineae bacterium]